MNLSEHFTLEELTRSQVASRLGIPNDPDDATIDNLKALCETLLEPARDLLGVPLHIDSGYRGLALNTQVGGSPTSEHCFGCAADFIPGDMSLQDAFDKIRTSDLPYDQVIFECNAWIHLGMHPGGASPRHMALLASGGPGHWSYHPA
jgi:zinc D-Ala-D-Ala carboxypeptidase